LARDPEPYRARDAADQGADAANREERRQRRRDVERRQTRARRR